MAEEAKPLPDVQRFVTDHDTEGKAIFSKHVQESVPATVLPSGDIFRLAYASAQTPVDFTSDLPAYAGFLADNPGLVLPGGSVLRVVDILPGGVSPMHRTVSLDYGVVLEGEIELELDGGEIRVLKRGDICVQRGTMHRWKNASKTQWGRMLFVLQESKPIQVAGTTLAEDYGIGMAGVKSSSS